MQLIVSIGASGREAKLRSKSQMLGAESDAVMHVMLHNSTPLEMLNAITKTKTLENKSK